MGILLAVHIATASAALIAGYLALFAAKGGRLHKKSGMAFLYLMITMAATGAIVAVARNKTPHINVPVTLLTIYLVVTALTTVKPTLQSRRVERGLLALAVVTMSIFYTIGVLSLSRPAWLHGFPTPPFFLFGTISLLAIAGDVRLQFAGGVQAIRGGPRLARHLWRMCTAMLIAALSAAVQFGKMIPKEYKFPGMMSIPGLVILVLMFYWLWRTRWRQAVRHAARNAGAPVMAEPRRA